jgi:glutaconate CoA-transferase subunit A
VVLPGETITAIAVCPGGAAPSYAQDFYRRDNASYLAWDAVSRSRERFGEWLRDLRGPA